jgi:hypothetical protein
MTTACLGLLQIAVWRLRYDPLNLLAGAALISVSINPLNADASDARWCAVISRSDGDVHWDCSYRSIEECRPNVIASNGNRSFCSPSPYYVANPTELRNSRPASQTSSKTSAKSEKAIAAKKETAVKKETAAKKESPRHRANTATAINITTMKPKKAAMAANPTAAKPRSETEPVEANSRTITKPEVPSSAQLLATPDPVSKKETTAIGGKAEGPATGRPSETSDPVPKKEPTTIAGRTEGPATGQPSKTSDPVPKKEPTTIAGRTEGPTSGQPAETSGPVPKKEPTTIAGRTEGPASDQLSETVLKKAKITVAAKMENPASVEFVDINRAVKKIDESVEIICGHVKGKKNSGEAIGERPFLYLVKEDEAFIVGGNPDSMAAIVYRAHCISANSR